MSLPLDESTPLIDRLRHLLDRLAEPQLHVLSPVERINGDCNDHTHGVAPGDAHDSRTASAVAPASTVAHSPLPWHMREANQDYPAYVSDPDDYDLAVMYGPSDDIANANARFIVDACNQHHALIAQRDALLAACAEAGALLEDWEPRDSDHAVRVSRALALIASATELADHAKREA